jgi:glycosyltransferase involved in cell wall biosynthesis
VAKFLTGDYSQNWQPAARAAACAIAKEIRIDACMGEHGPDAGLYLARWFSESFGAPWVVDFRDPILQPFSPLGRRLYKPMARRLMRTASAAVNVNRVWAELDHEMFSIQSWSIPNGFDPDEFEGDLAPDGAQQFTIAYIGNIIPQQRIESFIEGLALLRRVDEESFRSIRFLYRGLANERVGRVVTAAGVGDVADIGERTERKAAIELIRGADLLLLLSIAEPDEQDIYYSRGIYPAKAFEYFGARRPIICVPGDSGLLDELIERTGTGVSLRSPREVADYLSQAVREWRSERRLPYRSRQAEVCRYTRRNLTAQLADLLNLIS